MDEAYINLLLKMLELDRGTTLGPWRFQHLIDGGEARMLIDKSGYQFARIDDLQNGEFIAAAKNAIPAIKYLMYQCGYGKDIKQLDKTIVGAKA